MAKVLFGSRSIWVLGDSHVQYLSAVEKDCPLDGWRIERVQVDGATASGLPNPNSMTRAGETFRSMRERIDGNTPVLFLLGEVDCGFTIWLRSLRREESAEAGLEHALREYQRLLEYFAPTHYHLGVISAPPPTIQDSAREGVVANLRSTVTASLVERAQLTIRFNEAMQRYCREKSLAFLDLHSLVTDDDGLPHARFLNEDPTDHHLASEKVAPVLRTLLNDYLTKSDIR